MKALRNSGLGVEYMQNPGVTFSVGAVSGACTACCLYPFDIVRMASVSAGRSHFAWSTIPFTSFFLGIYFWRRDVNRGFSHRFGWALASTGIASAAELPFDYAKLRLMGGIKSAAMASALRVPLGSFMLVAYDHMLNGPGNGVPR